RKQMFIPGFHVTEQPYIVTRALEIVVSGYGQLEHVVDIDDQRGRGNIPGNPEKRTDLRRETDLAISSPQIANNVVRRPDESGLSVHSREIRHDGRMKHLPDDVVLGQPIEILRLELC